MDPPHCLCPWWWHIHSLSVCAETVKPCLSLCPSPWQWNTQTKSIVLFVCVSPFISFSDQVNTDKHIKSKGMHIKSGLSLNLEILFSLWHASIKKKETHLTCILTDWYSTVFICQSSVATDDWLLVECMYCKCKRHLAVPRAVVSRTAVKWITKLSLAQIQAAIVFWLPTKPTMRQWFYATRIILKVSL